jgi:competence ComEA-like helix-hairpin-helix protein
MKARESCSSGTEGSCCRRCGPFSVAVFSGCAVLITVLSARRSQELPVSAPQPIPTHRVDLNRADVSELALLPDVGPALAQVIAKDRAAHGPFGSVGELSRVPGVGPATLEAIRPHATVNAGSDPPTEVTGGGASG